MLFARKIWCVLLTDLAPPLFPDQCQKRSVLVSGHRTSVSLEPAFWDELRLIAEGQGVSLNNLVTTVDETRKSNLSSALRLYILRHVKKESARKLVSASGE